MRKSRLGFTIIEVSLFLAISGLLFVGIAAGTGLNVARQRYNNAVEDYTEFLRRLYSQTEDVQNGREGSLDSRVTNCTVAGSAIKALDSRHTSEEGRTNCAIYGKIAIFNERLKDGDVANTDKIMVYDIIGDVIDNDHPLPNTAKDQLSALLAIHAEFIAYEKDDAGYCKLAPAGGFYSYTPDWSSHIETTEKNEYWSGAVMIFRSPIDGTIHTYSLNLNSSNKRITDPIENTAAASCNSVPINRLRTSNAYLADYFNESASPHFTDEEIDFCVNSEDSYAYNGRRRNVRIKADGNGSAAVELVGFDSEDNKCE